MVSNFLFDTNLFDWTTAFVRLMLNEEHSCSSETKKNFLFPSKMILPHKKPRFWKCVEHR